MRKQVLTLAAFGLFLASRTWAGPVPVPGTDQRTLLRVHSTFRDQVRPDTHFRRDTDRLITRGGGLITIFSDGLDDGRPEVFAGTGRGTAADLATLGEALTAAPVANARDCSVDGGGRTGPVEITWYGRSGRRHRFTLLFLDTEPTESDRCPETVRALWDAIEIFEEQALRNP